MSDAVPDPGEDESTPLPTGDLGRGLQQDLADYLDDLLVYRMPFGRYEGSHLDRLPYEYLHWFAEKENGFPSGRLGELMEFVYHTKAVGAEIVFAAVQERRKDLRQPK